MSTADTSLEYYINTWFRRARFSLSVFRNTFFPAALLYLLPTAGMKGCTFLNIALLGLLLLASKCHAETEESEEVTLDPNPATIVYTAKPSTSPRMSSYEKSSSEKFSNENSSLEKSSYENSSSEATATTSAPTTETFEESYEESTDATTTEPTTTSSTDAPKVCSPIQVLYQKIQNELEKIVSEISNFQREALTKISQNEQHQQMLQLPAPPPPPPATAGAGAPTGVPVRMNLIQLWNMVQQLQQAQQLAASQQLLQQAATVSPPPPAPEPVTQYATR